MRWGQNHKGRTITLQLDPHEGITHPFEGLRCGDSGQRMQIVCVLVDDHEEPLNPDAGRQDGKGRAMTKSKNTKAGEAQDKPERSYTRSQMAAILTGDRDFQLWIGRQYQAKYHSLAHDHGSPTVSCDEALKTLIGIRSKTELDKPGFYADEWDKLETSFRFRDQAR